jgi:hypothetical protein
MARIMGRRGDGVEISVVDFLIGVTILGAVPLKRLCVDGGGKKGCGGVMVLAEVAANPKYRCTRCGNVKAY